VSDTERNHRTLGLRGTTSVAESAIESTEEASPHDAECPDGGSSLFSKQAAALDRGFFFQIEPFIAMALPLLIVLPSYSEIPSYPPLEFSLTALSSLSQSAWILLSRSDSAFVAHNGRHAVRGV